MGWVGGVGGWRVGGALWPEGMVQIAEKRIMYRYSRGRA